MLEFSATLIFSAFAPPYTSFQTWSVQSPLSFRFDHRQACLHYCLSSCDWLFIPFPHSVYLVKRSFLAFSVIHPPCLSNGMLLLHPPHHIMQKTPDLPTLLIWLTISCSTTPGRCFSLCWIMRYQPFCQSFFVSLHVLLHLNESQVPTYGKRWVNNMPVVKIHVQLGGDWFVVFNKNLQARCM